MANKIAKTLDFGTGDIYTIKPDWENVDDRPFGEFEAVFADGTLTFEDTGGGFGASVTNPIDGSKVVIGATVNVVWDGVEYNCEIEDGGGGFIIAGNTTGATGEPFMISFVDNDTIIVDTSATEAVEHEVKMTAKVAKLIPNTFIPAGPVFYTKSAETPKYLYHTLEHDTKVTKEELEAVLNSGRPICVKSDSVTYCPVVFAYGSSWHEYAYVIIYYAISNTGFVPVYTAEYTAE